MHERCLHVDGQQHTEPDQVDAQFVGHGGEQRHHDEREFKEVQEERQEEHHDVHDDQEAQLAAWQARQQMFHPQGAIHALEGQAEDGGAHQNEHHEARQFGGGVEGLRQQAHRQTTTNDGHDDGTQRTHRAAFGRCCHTQEDRAQHQEDQQQRGNQHEGHSFSRTRQQPQASDLVEAGGNESQCHAEAHGHHDGFVQSDLVHSFA